MVRSAFTAKRRTIFPTCVVIINIAKAVEAINPRINPNSVGKTSMRWKPMTLMMIANCTLMNKNQFVSSSLPNTFTVQSKAMLCLVKLIMGTCPVLANLQVAKYNGLCNSLHVHDVCTKHFKIDSDACGNFIPLSFNWSYTQSQM